MNDLDTTEAQYTTYAGISQVTYEVYVFYYVYEIHVFLLLVEVELLKVHFYVVNNTCYIIHNYMNMS